MSPDELEEKARLITQVLELQNTLDGIYFYTYICLHLYSKFMLRGTTKYFSRMVLD